MPSERLEYPLNHNFMEALNFALEVIAGDPGVLVAKNIYIDSTGNGGAGVLKWVDLNDDVQTVPLPAEGGGDADTFNGQAPAYYLARGNHTGTQLAATISNLATVVQAYRLDQFANPNASVNLNSQKIINLANGSANGDGANVGQVNSAVAGLASTGYVDAAVAALIDSAPGTLDTLNELAAALGDDPNFATTLTNAINARARKFSVLIGNGSATQIDVAHNFANRDIIYSVWEAATPWGRIHPGPSLPDTNTLRLNFTVAPSTNQYRVDIANVG